MARVKREERDRRVHEVAELLGLTELLERKPGQLSGGQRQRVAMGRAIVREPRAYLMDEPLSNLDAKLRVQMRADIADLQARLGVTTVYVTHDQSEAMTLGSRVAVLRDGRLQQCAPPRELYERPANAFVAGFIGSPAMSLVEVPLGTNGSIEIGGVGVALRPRRRPRPRHAASAPSRRAAPRGAPARGRRDRRTRRGGGGARRRRLRLLLRRRWWGGGTITARADAREAPGRGDAVRLAAERDARSRDDERLPSDSRTAGSSSSALSSIRQTGSSARHTGGLTHPEGDPSGPRCLVPRRRRPPEGAVLAGGRSGDHVYTAGQVGVRRERHARRRRDRRADHGRCSRTSRPASSRRAARFDDVVKVNVFLVDLADFEAVQRRLPRRVRGAVPRPDDGAGRAARRDPRRDRGGRAGLRRRS